MFEKKVALFNGNVSTVFLHVIPQPSQEGLKTIYIFHKYLKGFLSNVASNIK